MVISGEPTQDELINAWNEIIFEYGSSIKTEHNQYLYDLQKQIAELKWHINYVENAVFYLRHKYKQEFIDELKSLGYHGPYNCDDHIQYQAQLDRVVSLCKTNVFDLDQLIDEYKSFHKALPGETGKQSEEDFEEWIGRLSRFQGYRIEQQTTMVTELIGITNSYFREMKLKTKQAEDNG